MPRQIYPIPPAARGDPFGPQRYGNLKENLIRAQSIFGVEHIIGYPGTMGGEHNAWEVPRVCRQISGTTVGPSSSDITGVTNPSAGEYDLTLAASRFSTNIAVQVQGASGSDGKPYCANVEVVSATSVKVRWQKLTSALGVAQTWAATNCVPFSVAIHSDPLAPGYPQIQSDYTSRRGLTLSPDFATVGAGECEWNFPQDTDYLYRAFTGAHTSAGAHNVREVAKYSGHAYYDPTPKYLLDLTSASGWGSITRASAGVVTINYPATLTSPVSVFATPLYAQVAGGGTASDIFLIETNPSTTSCIFYLYKYDTVNKWWTAADGDFFFAVYGS